MYLNMHYIVQLFIFLQLVVVFYVNFYVHHVIIVVVYVAMN